MGLDVHSFSMVKNMPDKLSDATGKTLLSKHLGNEFDFIVNYTLNKATAVEFGYCVMAATNSLEYVKLTSMDKAKHTATWAYLMISIKPEIFSTAVKK